MPAENWLQWALHCTGHYTLYITPVTCASLTIVCNWHCERWRGSSWDTCHMSQRLDHEKNKWILNSFPLFFENFNQEGPMIEPIGTQPGLCLTNHSLDASDPWDLSMSMVCVDQTPDVWLRLSRDPVSAVLTSILRQPHQTHLAAGRLTDSVLAIKMCSGGCERDILTIASQDKVPNMDKCIIYRIDANWPFD